MYYWVGWVYNLSLLSTLFGNLLDFVGTTPELLDMVQSYFDRYGKTLVAHDGPLSRVVATIDGKFAEYIMSSTKLIDKASNYEFFHNWLGTGLLTSTGAKWKERRRMLTPAFHFSILENFVEVFESVGDIFIEKLQNEVDKDSVDINPFVTLCTLDIICEAAMGVSVNAQDNKNSKYVKSVKTMCTIITERNFSLVHVLCPLTWNYFREKSALKVLHGHTTGVINRKLSEYESRNKDRNGFAENEPHDKRHPAFLELLIQSSYEKKSLSVSDIREEVDTFMFEGHDTTSSAISFTLYSLAMHPDIQEKAVQEQKSIFGDLKSAKATIADIHKMKYLELIIKETLRLYPSVPFFARKVTEDFEFDGVFYPKGINILVWVFFMHRNSEYFPDADKFIPERFLNYEIRNPYVYMPFSAGPRNCIVLGCF